MASARIRQGLLTLLPSAHITYYILSVCIVCYYVHTHEQVEDMKKALWTRNTGWGSTYVSIVQSCHKADDSLDEGTQEVYSNYNTLIGWLTAFHYLLPIEDEGYLQGFVHRLQKSKYELNLQLVGTTVSGFRNPARFHSCNCETFIHYGLCTHAVAFAKKMKLIAKIPPYLDPTSRRPGSRKGRLPNSQKGGARGES